MRHRPRLPAFVLAILFGLGCAACTPTVSAPPLQGPLTTTSGKHDRASIDGAGATFPAIVYQAWFYDYNHKVAPGVQINYQAIGSGGGIQQFIEGDIDFGATDAPMSDSDLHRAPDAQHLPTVLGAVVLTYNLPNTSGTVRLDGPTVAAIYLGKVKTWDDPVIAKLNPGLHLPAETIRVVQRSDGSGTSFVFTEWLSKVSPDWEHRVGASKSPNWPVGVGGRGNDGLAQVVRQTPFAIGYADFSYAAALKLPVADIKNSSGNWVTPSLDSISAAVTDLDLPADYRISITNPPGTGAYPISSFTFLLLRKSPKNCELTTVLLRMLWWAYHDPLAIEEARSLLYAPLPAPVLARVDETLHSFSCNGEPLLSR